MEGEWHDVYIRNNYVQNVARGIAVYLAPSESSCSGLHVYHNVFGNLGIIETTPQYQGWGIQMSSSYQNNNVENIDILNNTFVANEEASTMWGIKLCPFGDTKSMTIRNNIIQGFDYAPVYGVGDNETNIFVDMLSIENNLFYRNGNSDEPRYVNLNPTNNTTQNNLQSDPLFISESDFHLQPSSPAIDAGLDVGLAEDYEGNPLIGLPDIGAFEH